MIAIGDPLAHFLWFAGSLFVFFYLVRIIADYGTAVPLGFAVLGAITQWDNNTVNVNTRLENTLWLLGAVALAVVVTLSSMSSAGRIQPPTSPEASRAVCRRSKMS
jgi:hypothetical protein